MNKSDLKDGMVVTIRGGNQCILSGDFLFRNNFTISSTILDYNEDLTSKKNKHSDIVKVFSVGKEKELWKRKEIDWDKVPVGTKVMVKLDFDDEYQKAIFLCNNSKYFLTYSTDKGIEHWNYCKLAEAPKEEVTAKELKNEFTKFCEVCGITCRGCKFSEGLKEDCRTLWILDNYNVTRKDNK